MSGDRQCAMCGEDDDDCSQMRAAMRLSHALTTPKQHDLFRAYIKTSAAHVMDSIDSIVPGDGS